MIDKYRSYENYSWITIRKILEFYGYKTTSRKPKAFREVLDVFEYMINNHMIEVKQDLDSLTYDMGIEIKIVSENFDNTRNFSKLTSSQYNMIMMADTSLNRENILLAFLYINSYIIGRKKNDDGSEESNSPQSSPEAFFKSIENMAKELSMSKDTINQCINYLTTSSDSGKALLVKREVGSIKQNNNPPKNVPNIYVLNKQGYQQEIEWALLKMSEVYQVTDFDPPKRGKYK